MKTRFVSSALPFLFTTATLVACGAAGCSGSDAASVGDDGRGGDVDAAAPAPDGGAPTPPLPPPVNGVPGPDGADAAPDAGGPVDPCTLERPDGTAGVFVAPGGDVAPVCGAIDKPCASVSDAIEIATKGGRAKVYVAAGLYDRETITLRPGITVQGGWNRSATGAWTKDCGASPSSLVTLRAPAGADRTVVASFTGPAAAATLDTLSVESKAFADKGQSLYGIFVTGASTHLVLDRVDVTVRAGGDGADGVDAVPTPPARSDCAIAGDGHASLVPGANGAGAPAGSFTAGGYAAGAAVDGAAGSAGATGPRVDGDMCVTGKPCTPCTVGKDCDDTTSIAPTENIIAKSCVMTVVSTCGLAGTSGCGGAGGARGTLGKNGGSSVGVFVSDGTVVAASSAISAAKGGAGGHGGRGATGGKGATSGIDGTPGGTTLYGTCVVDQPKGTVDVYNCIGGAPVVGKAGAKGGAGGDGSAGGGGGGGSGGFSYSYVVVGGGKVSATDTSFGFKEGGVGGIGGAAGSPRNDGMAGVGGVRN
jgi:hypothetical protein